MLFARFLLALLATASFAIAQEPQWIWHTQDSANGEVRYFRKTFTIAAVPTEATLSVSCDNRAKVFLNGTEVGRSEDWKQPLKARVEKQLKAGENVLAVRGTNEDGVAALIVRLEAKGSPNRVLAASDTTWLSFDKEVTGWEKAGFSPSGWTQPITRGKLGVSPWGDVFSGNIAAGSGSGPTKDVKTLPGFKAELIRAAEPGEGSWVSMAVDGKGRLIVCSQSKPTATWGGLLRLTLGADGKVAKTEKLESAIGSAMGLLWAFDSLYVDGEGPQGYGLYRMKFRDDQPLDVEFLYKGANGEHGSHGLVLGPDKQLYLMAGNHTNPPKGLKPTSPFKGWAEDHLLPRQWDANGHAVGVMTPGGHVLRSADEGKSWEIFCGSFRNAYDLDFNADGELFTFDSDMEWDIGAPWYRPTRVNHLVSGGEYGWRSGTSNEPAYYTDSLPAAVDIGLGSPTGVKFGTAAKGWPAKYRRAFFAMDWAYGKLFAVHLTPDGSTYRGSAETFVEGKPLNIADLEFANGNMYFICGGRGTQAGLYRVTYEGAPELVVAPETVPSKDRTLRKSLEAFHGKQDPKAVETAWPHLDSPDRFIRWAARTAVEFQPVASWQARALEEKRPWASLEASLALTRCASTDVRPKLVAKLAGQAPLATLSPDQQLAKVRIAGLVFTRLGAPTEEERQQLIAAFSSSYPTRSAATQETPIKWPNAGVYEGKVTMRESERLNRELSILLTFLDAPGTVEKTMGLMRAGTSPEEQLFYAFVLRNGRQYGSPGEKATAGPLSGWTTELRREYFNWFFKADREFKGGASFKKFLANIKKDAVETLADIEKGTVADLIHPASVAPATAATTGHPRGFVKMWRVDELLPIVANTKGDVEKGRKVYTDAQCALCHRFGQEGGANGPDLTGLGSRFARRDVLEAIIDPNKVVSDQYRNEHITTKNKEVIGRLVDDRRDRLVLMENPFGMDRTEVKKSDITKRELSPYSPMPPGLLNLFSQDEIVDLLTFLESGGK
ncbi:MAG TPA: c-type cytochrome [Chthoniobacteraceae bacterium]|nr:c-type cytochrome [Chthoniobacteraceae bacterium]